MFDDLTAGSCEVAGAPGVRRLGVAPDRWLDTARRLADAGGRLLALWTSRTTRAAVHAAFLHERGVLVVTVELPPGESTFAGLAEIFPAASRLQRAAADLTGIRARDADTRPWLRHAAWPGEYFPLAPDADCAAPGDAGACVDDYAFVRVAGDGVHEIAVGPVHAGIIEPGHFRFSVVGEKVLRLEERLGYVHKGIERLFTRTPTLDAHRVAARISGDSTVAYSWAFCQALEGMLGITPPDRAAWLRALALESERIANHLGDLGALGNDAGFAFGLAQFPRLKELWLRQLEATLGRRYLFDFVVPGGVGCDAGADGLAALAGQALAIADEVAVLRDIYDEHAGVRDRFLAAGVLTPDLARRLGVIGLAGRASGQDRDLRVDLPCEPYGRLGVRKVLCAEGDVAARVQVRFDELLESIRLVHLICDGIPGGGTRTEVPAPPLDAVGMGLIEGWRGPVIIWLETGSDGSIHRCHPQDPSSLNWPALEHAVIGNIVPDFPLVNKSFNLSYSGHDL